MAKFVYDPNGPKPRFLTASAREGWLESKREWESEQARQAAIEAHRRLLDADSAQGHNRLLREEASANRFQEAAAAGLAMHERNRAEEEAAFHATAGRLRRQVIEASDHHSNAKLC